MDNLEAEMAGKDVLLEPFEPMEGVTVAFVIEQGAPIELMHLAHKPAPGAEGDCSPCQ